MIKRKMSLFRGHWFLQLKRWLWRKFDKSITNESIRELPTNVMYPFGALVTCFYVTLFAYFSISGIITDLSSHYLAPLDDTSGQCQTYSREISSVILVDTSGYYNGDQDFYYSNAIYKFAFSRLKADSKYYAYMLTQFKDSVDKVGHGKVTFLLFA